jgi:septum formation protein
MDIVLASTSPRRIQLMKAMGLEFRIVDPAVDEATVFTSEPRSTAMARAEVKALTVSARNKDAVVIAADTVVVLEGQILNKAKHETDVRNMLRRLSGKEHQVMTAVAICYPGISDAMVEVDVADITFRDLSKEEIERYVGTGEGVGKAGGYAVQGIGGQLIQTVEGDRQTVIGLPVSVVERMLEVK